MKKKVIAKLTRAELNQMISEEYTNLKKVVDLRNKKEAIQEEIKQLKESFGLDEVESAGNTDKGDAYYMKDLPVQKFEKKGTHLKEMDVEMDMEEEEECGEIEAMLKDLGKKLDSLLSGKTDEEEMSDDAEEEMSDDTEEEMSDDAEEEMSDDAEEEMSDDDDSMEDLEVVSLGAGDIEIDENTLSEEDIVAEETEETVEESTEETIEEQDGESVANEASEDTVNDNMEKVDNKNEEADKLYEGAGQGRGSRLNPEGNKLMNEEFERMRKLAGFSKD